MCCSLSERESSESTQRLESTKMGWHHDTVSANTLTSRRLGNGIWEWHPFVLERIRRSCEIGKKTKISGSFKRRRNRKTKEIDWRILSKSSCDEQLFASTVSEVISSIGSLNYFHADHSMQYSWRVSLLLLMIYVERWLKLPTKVHSFKGRTQRKEISSHCQKYYQKDYQNDWQQNLPSLKKKDDHAVFSVISSFREFSSFFTTKTTRLQGYLFSCLFREFLDVLTIIYGPHITLFLQAKCNNFTPSCVADAVLCSLIQGSILQENQRCWRKCKLQNCGQRY